MNYIEELIQNRAKEVHYDDFLMHYGLKGQKWGIRRWQNEDGTFNEAGKERYFGKDGSFPKKSSKESTKDDYSKWLNDGKLSLSDEDKQKITESLMNDPEPANARKLLSDHSIKKAYLNYQKEATQRVYEQWCGKENTKEPNHKELDKAIEKSLELGKTDSKTRKKILDKAKELINDDSEINDARLKYSLDLYNDIKQMDDKSFKEYCDDNGLFLNDSPSDRRDAAIYSLKEMITSNPVYENFRNDRHFVDHTWASKKYDAMMQSLNTLPVDSKEWLKIEKMARKFKRKNSEAMRFDATRTFFDQMKDAYAIDEPYVGYGDFYPNQYWYIQDFMWDDELRYWRN